MVRKVTLDQQAEPGVASLRPVEPEDRESCDLFRVGERCGGTPEVEQEIAGNTEERPVGADPKRIGCIGIAADRIRQKKLTVHRGFQKSCNSSWVGLEIGVAMAVDGTVRRVVDPTLVARKQLAGDRGRMAVDRDRCGTDPERKDDCQRHAEAARASERQQTAPAAAAVAPIAISRRRWRVSFALAAMRRRSATADRNS